MLIGKFSICNGNFFSRRLENCNSSELLLILAPPSSLYVGSCSQRTSFKGGGIKKFVVCIGKQKTNQERRLDRGGRGVERLDLSIQMVQDVLYEQPLGKFYNLLEKRRSEYY
jgi:hypothetical protein